MKRKTIVFICNNKGGIGKSTSAAFFGDALVKLGFTVLYLSGDRNTNLVLKTLQPSTLHFDIKDPVAMDQAMQTAIEAKEDIVLFDLAGNSSGDATAYFSEQDYEIFREAGLRFVVAIVANQHNDAIVGGIEWLETFMGNAEPIIFANGNKTPEGEAIDLTKIAGATDIIDLANNRIVEIPRFSKRMLNLYTEHPAVPSSYFPDGEKGKQLGHNMISASPWHRLQTQIVRSVAKHAEWLVGKPIPKPFDLEDQSGKATAPNAAMERLKSYKNAMINNPTILDPVSDGASAGAKKSKATD
jgi:hypothetical protein